MKIARKTRAPDADLDITAFMNLMIVLVPILLLGMVFSRTTVIDVTLPPASSQASDTVEHRRLELIIRADNMRVDYPRGVLLKRIPKTGEGAYDFALLSLVLQDVKRQLRDRGLQEQTITILSDPDIDYQTIVSAMDTVRSFKAIIATSVVDAALFPDISFGDAPALAQESSL